MVLKRRSLLPALVTGWDGCQLDEWTILLYYKFSEPRNGLRVGQNRDCHWAIFSEEGGYSHLYLLITFHTH